MNLDQKNETLWLKKCVADIDDKEFQTLIIEIENRIFPKPPLSRYIPIDLWLTTIRQDYAGCLKGSPTVSETVLFTKIRDLQPGVVREICCELCLSVGAGICSMTSRSVLALLRECLPKPSKALTHYERKIKKEVNTIRNRRKWNENTLISRF